MTFKQKLAGLSLTTEQIEAICTLIDEELIGKQEVEEDHPLARSMEELLELLARIAIRNELRRELRAAISPPTLNDAAHICGEHANAGNEPASTQRDPLKGFLRHRTKEERKAEREALHSRDLLEDGLHRLREDSNPTRAQRPHVQRYLVGIDEERARHLRATERAIADKEYAERLYAHIVPMWNSVVEALRSIGIDYFERGGQHEWRCKIEGKIEEQGGYASEADAIKAALEWRIEQARKNA